MENVIFYFSGTGNSLKVAKTLLEKNYDIIILTGRRYTPILQDYFIVKYNSLFSGSIKKGLQRCRQELCLIL